ncbi:MAG: tripartite tricarboxylate transporter substrate binding protein [Betaproteobacteria bacterium]|nr:tripartite tricarboxylate transporter substrate binding protein [Betaproteobacteria bacterium]
MKIHTSVGWLLCLFAALAPWLALAQSYPARPVLMIMPLQGGSSLDVAIRIVTQKMSENMGQQIVIENQPGAAGMIGAERVMRAAPDGYTLAMFNDSVLTMIPNLRKTVAYDPVRSFAPVSLVANNSWVLIAHPSLLAKSVTELIALAKERPGELNYSSGGNGSPQHIAMELFRSMAGIKLTHVPYKGTTQATLDVISGQIPMMFSGTNTVVGQIREGKLRALAAGGAKRSPLLPEVPTVAESGLRDFEFTTWAAFFAPLATPKEIVARLNAETARALNAPDVRDRLTAQGLEVAPSTPEHLSALTKARLEQMGRIIRDAGIVIE